MYARVEFTQILQAQAQVPQRLSHNLPQLRVAGNRIINAETQESVILRGLNLSGLEYSSPEGLGSLAKARISETAVTEIIEKWNANVIRLPFNQYWVIERPGYDPKPYRDALEAVIEMAAVRGAYTILDLHWLDARTPRGTVAGRPNYVAPLPNLDSIIVWRQLAEAWRDETAIIYDIFNEPHDPLPDDPKPVLGIRSDCSTFTLQTREIGPKEWQPWARQLVSAVREKNPDALIFVPGTNWAYDLRDCVLPDITDVVYSTHVYVSKCDDWGCAFGHLAESVPVFAGEWGGRADDLDWGLTLASYFEDRGIGWTAWSWSDEPRLVEYPPQPPYNTTVFGTWVRDLLRAGPRLEAP